MAISTQERNDLIKLVVGMFNASPGAAYLADLTTAYEANGRSLATLAGTLAEHPIFVELSPTSQTASEFAAYFLAPLGLENDAVALDFVNARFGAGVSKGQIIYEALLALQTTTAVQYEDAQAVLNNKTSVAYYHSVVKSLSDERVTTLQEVLRPVTKEDSSIARAEAVLDTPVKVVAPPAPPPTPAAPSRPDLATASDSGSSSTDNITSVTTGTYTGTAEAGTTVRLYDTDGTTVLGTATATGGNWSITSSALGEGSHTLTAKATSTASIVSLASTGLSVTVDTTAPTTTVATVAFSADTGTSGTDFNTRTAAQTISGTTSANLVAGEIVEVSIDNGGTWATATTSVGASTWSLAGVTLTASDTLKVRVTDAAGNSGTAASQAYVLDTTAPTATIATAAFSADTGTSGTDFNTKTAAQTISGTTSANLVAGEIVEVSTNNGSTWTTATTSVGANTWSLAGVTLTGSDTLKVRVTDAAGNSGTVASQAYVLDTTAPTTTIATSAFSADTGTSGTDFNTKTAAQTISGTTSANLVAGEIVEVSTNNGSTWTTATTSVGANTWSLAGVALTSSDTLKVRVTDTAGNSGTAASQAYVLDTTAPATTIATAAFSADTGTSGTDFNTRTAAQTISGTTSANLVAGEIVEVSTNNGSAWTTATTSVGASTWSLAGVTLTASDTLKVRVTDAAGNSGTAASQAYVLDTAAPAATIATAAFSADTGTSGTDFNTKTAAQTISGTTSANLVAGEIVEVSTDNGSTWTTATTSVGANTWSLAGVTLTASDTLKVRVSDTAGNSGTAASQAYVLDTTAPTTTVATQAFSADTGTSGTDFNTKTAAQTISGTTSANLVTGEIVEVSIDNGSTWATATTSVGANTWSLAGATLTASDTLKVRVTDTAGNSGTAASQAYVLDTTAPSTTIATAALSADTGTSGTDLNTKTAAQTISGMTSANLVAGEIVEVSIDNGSTWTTATTSVGANTWSLAGVTLTASDTLKVRVTDAAGNSGTAASQAYVLDTTAPTTTIATQAFSADTGISATDFNTKTVAQTISGTTSANLVAGEIVEVSINNGSTWTTATTSVGANAWSLAGVTLTGSDTLKVRVADAAGNNGTAASQAYVLDTTAPTTAVATKAFWFDTGTSAIDFITRTAAQTISGTINANLVAGEIVEVSMDNGSTWTTATTSVGSNLWSLAGVTLTASDTLKVRVADAAGNSSATISQAYVLDTTAPTTTIATAAFSADTGASGTDFNTSAAAQTISGTTSANLVSGEIVEVSTDNGSTWTTATTSVGANTWSLAGVTLTASDTLKVRVTDAAGNSGTVASQAYVLDQAAPAAPGAPVLATASDSGSSSSDSITNVTTGTYTGTAEAGASVTLYDTDGTTVLGTATATGGNWSITSSALGEGDHTLTAKATDTAGNTGTASTGLGVRVDTTAPTATIATMAFSDDTGVSSTDFNTSAAAQTISGTTSANIEAGEIVEVSINNGGTWATATTSVGANTWSLAGVTLAVSSTLKVRVSDTAGNAGTAASQAYVLDLVPVPATYTLTAGNDTVTAGNADDTINGTVAGAFASGDSIDGAGGSDTLTVTDATNLSTAGTTVVNVETASLTSSGTVSADTTSWTGLTSLAVSAAGLVTVNSNTTTAVSITETGAGQGNETIQVDGGSNVTIASAHQGIGAITVGGTTAPTGTVTVTSSVESGYPGGPITVMGGTTVSVTATSTHAAGTTVTQQSNVEVNGGASTTDVTVIQPAVATAATAVSAVTGVSAVTAVAAAPGTQPVTAVTAVKAVAAVTAVAGVSANGAVSITDLKYNTATANTISTVTLSSYGAGSFIRSNALTSLSLSGTGGTLAITNATNGAGAVPTANTTLALTLNGLSGASNTITDTNNEITTLNVTTTGADSALVAFADTALTTLTIAGTQVLRLSPTNNTSLTSITVSGAAGYNDGGTFAGTGFSTRGAATTFTTTSSGAISISIDATTQSFTGSTGVDTIRISSRVDATQTVTGGSSTSDELILEGGAYALTAATGAKVTGFEILGLAANVTGTVDMSNLASGFTKAHIIGNSSVALTKVPANFSLQVDKASTQVTVVYADATGPADTINVSLGTATSDSVNFGTLIFKDSASVGIGTVNLVSNGVDITPGDAVANFNTTVITDNGLSNLNVSGTQGLKITTINQATSQATSFTLNNTNTGSAGVTIGVLTDSKLTSLNFAGTGTSAITTLTASTTTSLAIDNSGSKTAMVKAMTSSANLRTLNLSGNVQIGDGLVTGTGMTLTYTQGLTIDGSTDHAHVKLTLAGAGSGFVDNITLGNGNNTVTNVSTAGTVNLTLGSGANYITLGGATTNSTGRYNVTLDAGSAPDYITVGTGGTTYATTPNYVITGAQTGDRISFNADSLSSANSLSATTPGASASQTITAVEAAAAFSHGVAYAVYGGNTYLAQSASGTLASTDTTIVQLMGVHTFTASTGYVTLAS